MGEFAFVAKYPFLVVMFLGIACLISFEGILNSKVYASPNINEVREMAESGNPDGQFALGYMYAHGIKVEKDSRKAIKWYKRAAEKNHADAQNNLGVMYYKGMGVPKDYESARKWYKKAAQNGHDGAAGSLAGMYMTGEGGEKNGWEAIKWFELAAYHGFWRAQHDIGIIYQNGFAGVPIDLKRAYAWLLVASIRGGARIENMVERLASQMSQTEIAEGEKLSAEIWSKVEMPIHYPVDGLDILLNTPNYQKNKEYVNPEVRIYQK